MSFIFLKCIDTYISGGALEALSLGGARKVLNWTEPTETKVSWAGPAETKVSWTGPTLGGARLVLTLGGVLESWTEPAETLERTL